MNIMHVCIVALHEGLHWYGQGGGYPGISVNLSRDRPSLGWQVR